MLQMASVCRSKNGRRPVVNTWTKSRSWKICMRMISWWKRWVVKIRRQMTMMMYVTVTIAVSAIAGRLFHSFPRNGKGICWSIFRPLRRCQALVALVSLSYPFGRLVDIPFIVYQSRSPFLSLTLDSFMRIFYFIWLASGHMRIAINLFNF